MEPVRVITGGYHRRLSPEVITVGYHRRLSPEVMRKAIFKRADSTDIGDPTFPTRRAQGFREPQQQLKVSKNA